MQVAASSPILLELLEQIRADAFAKTIHAERMNTDWLHLYRDPEQMSKVIHKVFSPEINGATALQNIARGTTSGDAVKSAVGFGAGRVMGKTAESPSSIRSNCCQDNGDGLV